MAQRGGARPGAGRKKGQVSQAKRDLAEQAKEHAETALGVLVSVAQNSRFAPAARVSAATAILDRAYGKPRQSVDRTAGDQVRVNIRSTVNAAKIRKEKRNGRDVLIVPSATLPDDVVMNGILYPALEIEKSFKGLERTPAPLGHPQVNGKFVSARDPEGINQGWIGAWNENVRRKDGRVFLDKVIDVERANQSEGGRAVLDAIDKGEPISTSTGLLCLLEAANGDVEHKFVARNIAFDHDAILLDEDPAASPDQGVGMMVNSAGQEIEVINSAFDEADRELDWAVESALRAVEKRRRAPMVDRIKAALIEAILGSERASPANRKEDDMTVSKEQFDALSAKVDTLSESLKPDALSGQAAVVVDKVGYDYRGTPVPIFSTAYGREWREWNTLQSENFDALSDDQEAHTAKIRRNMAQYVLDGDANIVFEGYTATGIRTNPLSKSINLGSAGGGANIDLTTADSDDVDTFVTQTLGAMLDANLITGKVNLYVSPEIGRNLDKSYSGSSGFKGGTLLSYLLTNRRINKIEVTYELTGNQFFGFVARSEYIRPLIGMAVNTTAMARLNPTDNYQFLVMGALGLEIRADINGRTGVFYSTVVN